MTELKRELVPPLNDIERKLIDRAVNILDMATEALEEYARAGVRQAREDLRVVDLMLAAIERDESAVRAAPSSWCHNCKAPPTGGTYDEQDAQGRGIVTRCRRCGFALAVES